MTDPHMVLCPKCALTWPWYEARQCPRCYPQLKACANKNCEHALLWHAGGKCNAGGCRCLAFCT